MDATTLAKLKKEAAEALSRHLNTSFNNDAALAAGTLVKVLETLDGMKADVHEAVAMHPCMHAVYGKGTCLLPHGHITDHAFESSTRRIAEDAGPTGTYAMPKNGPAPTHPRPCSIDGCTYLPGHGGDCLPKHPCPPPHAPGCCLEGPHEVPTMCMNRPCPYGDAGCPDRQCVSCVKDARYAELTQAEKTNAPSGQAMLLDGPAPTPAQVAHIRAEMLEEAAKDVEALSVCIPNPATVARILRNMKPKVSK